MGGQIFLSRLTVFLFCNFLQREVSKGCKYRVLTETNSIWYYCKKVVHSSPLFRSRNWQLCYNFVIQTT